MRCFASMVVRWRVVWSAEAAAGDALSALSVAVSGVRMPWLVGCKLGVPLTVPGLCGTVCTGCSGLLCQREGQAKCAHGGCRGPRWQDWQADCWERMGGGRVLYKLAHEWV